MSLEDIAYCRIHPAIGIARVGGSEEKDGYFIGPEVPGATPAPPGANGWKDKHEQILRQVARFRIYGYGADGTVIAELTPDNADIEWTVHMANHKAAWYDFDMAMDIPEFDGSLGTPPLRSGRRNANVVGADRAKLVIDPGPRSISGKDTSGKKFALTGGRFYDIDVPLGELRTDDAGRLLVFGAHGISGSKDHKEATTFANNVGWYDDVADGPVTATVSIQGQTLPVEHGWVVVAPPDYAPGIIAFVTMWDVIRDAGWQIDSAVKPRVPSYTKDIAPLFVRLAQNQWVNAGFGKLFGFRVDENLSALLPRLGDNSEFARPLRERMFARFRSPDFTTMQPDAIPPVYGDGMDLPPHDPRQWLSVTRLQYEMLRQWAEGDFVPDWTALAKPPQHVEELPLQEQPEAIDIAALDNTIGGPFHPGCEMTWPLRQPIMYASPFRLKLRTGPEKDYGAFLTSKIALSAGGPLDGSGPGDISRWMAVPWQTDTSSCLYAYVGWQDGVFLPTFWPVRVPNTVLTKDQYDVVMDTKAPMADRRQAFSYDARQYWLRELPPRENYKAVINTFVKRWNDVGIVTEQPGPSDKAFPNPIYVELGVTIEQEEKLALEAVDLAAAGRVEERTVDANQRPADLPNPRKFR